MHYIDLSFKPLDNHDSMPFFMTNYDCCVSDFDDFPSRIRPEKKKTDFKPKVSFLYKIGGKKIKMPLYY